MTEFRVQFCNYPDLYPIEVLDVIRMRIQRLIGLREFYRLMRKYGITPTWALIYQGCVERKEFRVITPEWKELKPEEVERKVFVDKYKFVWTLRLKYTKRKHHQIHIEITVEGWFEKHKAIPEPTYGEMWDRIDAYMKDAFEEYMADHWHILVRELHAKRELDKYVSGTDEMYIEESYFKDVDEPLEGEITYVEFKVKRYEEADYEKRLDYRRAFEPYAEEKLHEFIEWIIETESIYFTRQVIEMIREIRERIKKARLRIKENRIEVARNITDLLDIQKELQEEYAKEELTDEEYKELYEKLLKKSGEILMEQVKKWCKRIREKETIGELNQYMKRIMNTKIWQSDLFAPLREYVLECERKRMNELLAEAVKKKEIRRAEALKRVEKYFRDRKEDIMKTTRSVRDLRDLIRRVRRSKLSDEVKEFLIKDIEANIEKVQRERCRWVYEAIVKAKEISELRLLAETVATRKLDFEPCYDDVRKKIRAKIRRLRRELYRKTAEDIVETVDKAKDLERVREVTNLCDTILKLPLDRQYSVFRQLIQNSKTYQELTAIHECLRQSDLYKDPKHVKRKSRLLRLIDMQSRKLLGGE